jgi:hypothetical protein
MVNVNISVLFKTVNIILENITAKSAMRLVSELGCRSGPRASEFGRSWGRVCQNLDKVWGRVCQKQVVVSEQTIRLNAHLVGSFL